MESQPKIKVLIQPREPIQQAVVGLATPNPATAATPSNPASAASTTGAPASAATPSKNDLVASSTSVDNRAIIKKAILREMKRSVPQNPDSLNESERAVINLDHQCRDHVIQKFNEVFQRNNEIIEKWGSDYDTSGLSEDLERELVLYSVIRCQSDGVTPDWSNRLFRQFYLHKALSIRDNLDPKSYIGNPNLLDRVLCGEVTHQELMRSSPQELYPERWVEITAEKIRLAEAGSTVVNMGTTSLYRCGRCKKRECTYTQAQTRSSDEAMTTFITCTNCGNRWKE